MPIDRLAHLTGQRYGSAGAGTYRGYQDYSLNPLWWIIGINFLVFILTIINSNVIYEYLGLIPAVFVSRPWSVATAMFVHAGFGHIFGNMLTLFFFGRALTTLVGKNKFLMVYFIGGLLGNIFYLGWGLWQNPFSIAVGASGAVYAVAGALMVMRPNLKVLLYFIIPMPLWVVILVFFVAWSFIPGVAWQAHLGGLILGLIAGYFFRERGRFSFTIR